MLSAAVLTRRLALVAVAGASLVLVATTTPQGSAAEAANGTAVRVAGVSLQLPQTFELSADESTEEVTVWTDGPAQSATTAVVIYTNVPAADAGKAADEWVAQAQASDPSVQLTADVTTLDGRDLVTATFAASGTGGALLTTTDDTGRVVAVVVSGQGDARALVDQVSASLRVQSQP